MLTLPRAAALALLSALCLPELASAQNGAIDGDARVDVYDALPPGEVVHVFADAGVGGSRAVAGPDLGALLGAEGGGACGAAVIDLELGGEAPEGDVPTAVAYTPDGSRVLVANRGSQSLDVFETATHNHVASIALSGSPNDVAVTSDGLWAVTANIWEDTCSIVDLVNDVESAVIPIGDQPGLVRCAPGVAVAIVGNTIDQTLSVIDVAAANETFRLAGAGFVNVTALSFEPGQITTSFTGLEFVSPTVALHANYWDDQLVFFDVALGSVTTVPCADAPRGVAAAIGAGQAAVSHTGSVAQVSVVDVATKSIAKTIATGTTLNHPIAIAPDASKAVCAVQNAAIVVNLVTNAVSGQISTASINDMFTTADGQYALCAGFQGSLISFASETEVKELNNEFNAYAGARSPAGAKGVLVAPHNAESLIFVDTAGAAGHLDAVTPSGKTPEADKPRRAAITPDGTRAVTTDVLSQTATIWDLVDGSALAVVPVGARPSGVAITPDGSKAVVANLDSPFVTVIDLATAHAANVGTSTRNSEVVISPDGKYAYVSVVTSDGIWLIDLQLLSVIGGKVPTGEMGSVFFLYQQSSGIALSHDGATLVACNSFDDTITVIDTAAWTAVATVPVGGDPVQAAFAPDDATIYVTNKTGHTVSIVSNAGAASAQTGTIPLAGTGPTPYEVVASPDGARLFVGCPGTNAVDVVDLGLGSVIASIPVPDDPQGLALSASGTCLRVASGTWSAALGPKAKVVINQAGALSTIDTQTLAIVDQVLTGEPGGGLAFDDCDSIGVIPAPFGLDGIVRARTGPLAGTDAYGCGGNPIGSLSVLGGAPVLGGVVTLGVDNPVGTQPAGSTPFLALSTAPAPGFPCGVSLPGYGMSAPGAAGELLLAPTPAPFAVLAGAAWDGATPTAFALPIPALCTLLGANVYAQGLMLDVTLALGGPFALTDGAELMLGR